MPAFVIRSDNPPSRCHAPTEASDDATTKSLWDDEGASHLGPTLRRRANIAFVPAQGLDQQRSKGKEVARVEEDEGKEDASSWYLQTFGIGSEATVAEPVGAPGTSRFVYRPPAPPKPLKGDGRSLATALVLDDDDDPPRSPAELPLTGSQFSTRPQPPALVCSLCAAPIDPPTPRALMLHNQAMGISHQLPARDAAPVVPPVSYGLKPVNRGWRMLEGMGWQEGMGLGYAEAAIQGAVEAEIEADEREGVIERRTGLGWAQQEGRKVPIRATEKQDRLGLGMSDSLAFSRTLAQRRRLPSDAAGFVAETVSGSALLKGKQQRKRELEEDQEAQSSAVARSGKGMKEMREEGLKRKEWVEKSRRERDGKRALLAYMNAD